MKTFYKIRLQRHSFKLATNEWSDKTFQLISKLCPLGAVSSASGLYIYMYKILVTLPNWPQHRVLEDYKVCSNDDPRLTLTNFTARSNLVSYAFVWEKGKAVDFSETIVVYDLKLATDDQSGKKFLLTLLTSKLCSLSDVLFPPPPPPPPPTRGYRHVLNPEKYCTKSDFKEISWKLDTNR